MGQYYKAVVLKNDKKTVKNYIMSWDFDNGAKLMEHSYIGNVFVGCLEKLLIKCAQCVVWAGDYADGEPDVWDTEGDDMNIYNIAENEGTAIKNEHPFLKGEDIWNMSDEKYYAHFPYRKEIEGKDWFVLNHDKKQYYKRPKHDDENNVINPLPLLTCEGNGRGGGDYEGTHMELVGTWSRDSIEYLNELPDGCYYTEIHPDFREDR